MGRESWPVRIFRQGAEPADDLSASSTPQERLAMLERLTLEAFALGGGALPAYPRAETPVVLRPLRQ
jgi:hypothetical protein